MNATIKIAETRAVQQGWGMRASQDRQDTLQNHDWHDTQEQARQSGDTYV
jgi:hypothetical protein